MSARRFLRLTHGWMGVVLAVFIVLIAGSGASLAFMSEMFLAQYGDTLEAEAPQAGAPYLGVDAMIGAAEAARGEDFATVGILMPHTRVSGVSTAMVFGSEGDGSGTMMVSVDPWTAEHKGAFWLNDAFGHDMLDFHHELVMGDIGATFVSVLGLLLVVFALTGLWLWWPRRGGLWRKARAPALKGKASAKLFQLHGWLGVWTAALVVVFALTGTAVVKPDWFGPMLADAHGREPHGGAWARACAGATSPAEAWWLAQARFPNKQVSTMYFAPGEPIHVYLRAAGDLNAMEGDSLVWVHPSCVGLVESFDFAEGRAAERLGGMMLSLHGGYSFGPILGPLLVIVTGLSLVFFSISGVVVFFTRTLLRKSRRRDESPHKSLQPAE